MLKQMELNPSKPANAGPLRYFQAHAVLLANHPNPKSTYALGTYELHTHPDAVERFAELAQQCRLTACLGGVYGYPALVNPANGILFAIVTGTGYTLVRLPQEEREEAAASFSNVRTTRDETTFADFGDQWIVFDLFRDDKMPITSWLNKAYGHSGEPDSQGTQANKSHHAKKKKH